MKEFNEHFIIIELRNLNNKINKVIENNIYNFELKKEHIKLLLNSYIIDLKYFLDKSEKEKSNITKMPYDINKYNDIFNNIDFILNKIKAHNIYNFNFKEEVHDCLGFYISKLYDNYIINNRINNNE